MAQTAPIKIQVLGLPALVEFLTAIEEITGTTNDPNTAANLRAAMQRLRTKAGR